MSWCPDIDEQMSQKSDEQMSDEQVYYDRQELLAKNMEKLRKLRKLKRPFLKFFKYYDPPRVAPCERACPGLSENV